MLVLLSLLSVNRNIKYITLEVEAFTKWDNHRQYDDGTDGILSKSFEITKKKQKPLNVICKPYADVVIATKGEDNQKIARNKQQKRKNDTHSYDWRLREVMLFLRFFHSTSIM